MVGPLYPGGDSPEVQVSLFTVESPIAAGERTWIDEHMDWFRGQFGDGSLHRSVVLPTDEFFPGEYSGTTAQVLAVVRRICRYMDIDPDSVDVAFFSEDLPPDAPGGITGETGHSAAGEYVRQDGRATIRLDRSVATQPMAQIATIAHELAHHRLLGEDRIAPDREDNEPLTDLLTVFLGLGIFTANAALEFSTREPDAAWAARRLGYLTEPMYGYALARFARMRGENRPDWAPYVDANPRSYLKKALRYLAKQTNS